MATRTAIKYFAHHTILVASLVTAADSHLPRELGDFKLVGRRPVTIAPFERELLAEYGLREYFGGKYVDSANRSMEADAYRFTDTLGAHAAFLALRPNHGVSPMIWNIDAVTGDGSTVLEFHNYVLRFSGALPTVSSALEELFSKLPNLSADQKPWDLHGRYLDAASTRMLLGPVSLARFARHIPLSIAAFRLGAKGRVASFETPAGRMTSIVFEYPSEAVAKERLTAFESLPQTIARIDRTCVGVVVDPIETKAAQELLAGYFCGPISISFDDAANLHGPMTLDEGIAWVLAVGVLGAGFALIRRAFANQQKPPA